MVNDIFYPITFSNLLLIYYRKVFFFLIIESDVTGLLGACFNSLVL